MIEITGVRLTPSGDSFMVYGQVGIGAPRVADVTLTELADAIGNGPANYDLQDLVPSIVDIAFPRLVAAFKS